MAPFFSQHTVYINNNNVNIINKILECSNKNKMSEMFTMKSQKGNKTFELLCKYNIGCLSKNKISETLKVKS